MWLAIPARAAEPTGGLNMAAIAGLLHAWTARGSATPAQLTWDVNTLLEGPLVSAEISRDTASGHLTLGPPVPETGCRALAQTARARGAAATLVATACPGPAGWLLQDIRDRDAPAPEHPPVDQEAAQKSTEPVRLRPLAVAPAWQGGLFDGPAPAPLPSPPPAPRPGGRPPPAQPSAAPAPPPRIRYCGVAIAFADGAMLQFKQSADAIMVTFVHPSLAAAPTARPPSLPAGRPTPPDAAKRTLYASFDHGAAAKLAAVADHDHVTTTAPAADRTLLRSFIGAATLEIGIDPSRLLGPYSLKGSQQSLDAMTACAAQEFAPKRPPG